MLVCVHVIVCMILYVCMCTCLCICVYLRMCVHLVDVTNRYDCGMLMTLHGFTEINVVRIHYSVGCIDL
jgi:hypothetical protein